MGEYVANKIRCKNCQWFRTLDKSCGICFNPSNEPAVIFVRKNQQMPFCFEERSRHEP